jgi:5-methylcytosine-specific restriction endonuclease McrA
MSTESFTLLESPSPIQELDRLGDEIAELSAHLDAATARLLALIREFDARGGWNTGFRSCAHWLSWRVGLAPGAARELVRVARALGTLPRLTEALAREELSYAKVRALTRVATPEPEARLVAVGRAGTAVHVEQIVRSWRRVDQQTESREAARQHAGRALRIHQEEDGTVVLHGRLTPEVGALLLRALDAAREALYQRTRSAQATSPNATLEEVGHVPAETSRRLSCDASRVVMRHDEQGRLLEIGARTRTIPPALRRALQHRDRSCRFPGCQVRVGQAHHVRHWAQGGPTILSNLVLLCRRHHRAVHEEGYRIVHATDGTVGFLRPDGAPLPDVPPPSALPDDPVTAIRERHHSQGLHVDGRTACPAWLGERLDVSWAIDVLHPRATSTTTG